MRKFITVIPKAIQVTCPRCGEKRTVFSRDNCCSWDHMVSYVANHPGRRPHPEEWGAHQKTSKNKGDKNGQM